MLHGITNQFSGSLHSGLFEDPGAVGADGWHRQVETPGYRAHGLATAEATENLEFAIRKLFVQISALFISISGQQQLGNSLTDMLAASKDISDRGHEVSRSRVLRKETRSACF